MTQASQFDSNFAFAQVRNEIKELMSFDSGNYQDDVIYVVNKLTAVSRIVFENFQSWNDEGIRDFVLSKHDPLKNIDFKSDTFSDRVRRIQEQIIIEFSWY